MSYDLTIQRKESESGSVKKEQIESFIASLPGVRRDGPNTFAYSDGPGRMFMNIYTDDAPETNSIGVSVPAAFSGTSGEAALLLCFKIAEQFGWSVFDEQLGDFLQKETLGEVLKTQRRYGNTAEEILRRRASGKATFVDSFLGYEILHHGKVAAISSLIIAVIVTVLLAVYVPGFAKRDTLVPFAFVVTWGALLGAKALVVTLWKKKKSPKAKII